MALNIKKIPVTIITGFLGSGKTTLIHQIAKNNNGKRLAIIVNEFGELGMDGEILKGNNCGCEEENVLELSNGCLCCTVQEEFLPTMLQLMERKQDIDHIIIETSGLALPKPLVRAFNWPELKPQITVDAVITVVDAVGQATGEICNREKVKKQRLADDNLDHESSIEELFEDQLSCADLIVLTKSDLINEKQLAKIKQTITNKIDSKIKIVTAVKGNISTNIVFGINAKSEESIEEKHSHHEHHHEHNHEHHHHDDEINAIPITIKVPHTPTSLINVLKQLVSEYEIYRIKGFINVKEKPMRMVVQGVANRFENYFDRKWNENEKRATKLIIIGKKLKEITIVTFLEKELNQTH